MPQMNAKNMALSPAVQDLGLGAQLQEQLDDAEQERRKRLLAQSSNQTRALGSSLGGMGASSTLGLGMGIGG
jgi:hypothetical protein